jgi:AcrR family transcriptional regulator
MDNDEHSLDAKLGRPRDPSRDAAILTATVDLLGEVSYDQVTVKAIAQRSGVGLATIYRRWPTKEELVVDAVASFNVPAFDPAEDTDPEQATATLVRGLADVMQGAHREFFPNLIGQVAVNPELAAALRSKVIEPRLEFLAEQIRRTTGADPDRARQSAELVPAWLIFHIVIRGQEVDDTVVLDIIQTALRAAR